MGVVAQLTPPEGIVDPGSEATCEVKIRNTGTVVDQITVDVVGKLSGWAEVSPETLNLLPDTEGTVTVTFRPPRVSTTAPGEVPFAIRVVSKEDTNEGSTVEEGSITIGSFIELNAELVPKSSRGRRVGRHQVAVDNHGNAPCEVQLVAEDADQRLNLKLSATSFTVEPGSATLARLKAVPKKRFMKGPNQSLPFRVSVIGGGSPKPLELDGTMLQSQLMPGWLLPVLGIVTAAAIALAILQFTILQPAINSAARDAAAARQAAEDAKQSPTPSPSPIVIPTAPPTSGEPSATASSASPPPSSVGVSTAPVTEPSSAAANEAAPIPTPAPAPAAPTTAPAITAPTTAAANNQAQAPAQVPVQEQASAVPPVVPEPPPAPTTPAAPASPQAPATTAARTTPPFNPTPTPSASPAPTASPIPTGPPGTVDVSLNGDGNNDGKVKSDPGSKDRFQQFDAEDSVHYTVSSNGITEQRTAIVGGSQKPNADGAAQTQQMTIYNGNGSLFTNVNTPTPFDRICGVAFDSELNRLIVAGQLGSGAPEGGTSGPNGLFGSVLTINVFDAVTGEPVPGVFPESLVMGGSAPGVAGGSVGCFDLIVQPGSKYLMGGFIQTPSAENAVYDRAQWFMWRVDSNGTSDSSFHSDGEWVGSDLSADVFKTSSRVLYTITGLTSQPDGKIVATGMGDADIEVVRLNNDGSPDGSFTGDFDGSGPGWAAGALAEGTNSSMPRGVAVQPDGKIVVAGYQVDGPSGDTQWRVDRFTAAGAYDTTFSSDGIFRSGAAAAGALLGVNMEVNASNQLIGILVAGSKDNNLAVGRLTPAGELDPAFGAGGVASTTFDGSSSEASGVFVQPQPDGRIVVAGSASGDSFVLARYFGGP